MTLTRASRRRWWLCTLYALLACALAGVFLLYFRAGLIMDLANFLWRCA
ncbi:MAG TPA: hypothetical protein VFH49_11535 [Aquabacterium sp.]|nr:hypothetical protein [Aquabacterium sp.]